jgi:hypothetical protein
MLCKRNYILFSHLNTHTQTVNFTQIFVIYTGTSVNHIRIFQRLFLIYAPVNHIRIFQRLLLIYAPVNHIGILQRLFEDGSCFHSGQHLKANISYKEHIFYNLIVGLSECRIIGLTPNKIHRQTN